MSTLRHVYSQSPERKARSSVSIYTPLLTRLDSCMRIHLSLRRWTLVTLLLYSGSTKQATSSFLQLMKTSEFVFRAVWLQSPYSLSYRSLLLGSITYSYTNCSLCTQNTKHHWESSLLKRWGLSTNVCTKLWHPDALSSVSFLECWQPVSWPNSSCAPFSLFC